MKRLLLGLLVVLMLLSPAYGAVSDTNRQKVYSVDSDVYAAIKWLYIAEGLALPSTTGPWTAGELDLMLSRLERAGVNRENSELFAFIEDELSETPRFNPGEPFGFTVGLDVAAEAYAHTDADNFIDIDSYARRQGSRYLDYNVPTPLLSVPFETWIGDNIYGYTSLDIGVNRTLLSMAGEVPDVDRYGEFPEGFGNVHPNATSFYHNIWIVPPSQLGDWNLNFPYRGFGSIGGQWWNLSIGRDKLSWGPGESGNFVIGDQIPYHDNARFTAYTDWFKYTFSASSFIHPMNYFETQYGNKNDPDNPDDDEPDVDWFNPFYDQTAPRQGIRMMLNHRIEFRLFDKVNLALTESIMYQNEEGSIDFMILSPTVVFHNYYIRGNANSLISLEADWTPVKHWNIYGQLAIDEFQLPGEFSTSGPPSALAYMLGTKFSYPMGKGVLYGSIEGVYTEPYFYLRDDGDSYDPYMYGNSFAVAFKEFANDGRANYDLNWVGYRYGGDAVVADFKVGYEVFDSWYVEGLFSYIAHGCFDIYTRWDNDIVPGGTNDPSAPSTEYPDQGSYQVGSNREERNAASHTFILTLEGGITPIANLDLFGRVDLVSIINNGNIKGEKAATDFQFTFGVKYSI